MAITTADGWFAAAKQRVIMQKTTALTTVAILPFSLWATAGNPGAGVFTLVAVTAGAVPTDVTAGAPIINTFGSGATGYLAAGRFRGSVLGGLTLYDRLFHSGTYTTVGAPTTTLSGQPSYSSRVPGGSDFTSTEILLEFVVTMTAAGTTVTITYTNQSGTPGRTTGAVSISSTTAFVAGRVLSMPLQAGDSGVQKIESVVITTASTGQFNVVVGRRLADFDMRVVNGLDAQAWDMIGGPIVFADSCLWMVSNADSTSSGLPTLALDIING